MGKPRGFTRAAVLWLSAGLAAWHGVEAKPATSEFVPDPDSAEAVQLDGSTWQIETDDYVASLSRLQDRERFELLQKVAGAHSDPFHSNDPSAPDFLTFFLEIESRTEGTLVFQPQRCRLITNRKEHRQPLDRPTIEATYGLLDRDVPAAYRAALPALLDGEFVLRAGEKASGLLVYRKIDPKTRSFVVQILVTNPSGDVVEVNTPYRRVKRKP